MARAGRRLRRVLAAAALASALSGLARLARAEQPTLVVLGSGNSVSSRIEAELVALGFHVVHVDGAANTGTPAQLQAAARGANAAAALSLLPSADGVEVWVVDRVTGKTLSRDVVAADARAEPERVIAVRVVELLRASLLELDLPAPPEGEVQPTPELRAAVGLPRVHATPEPEPAASEPRPLSAPASPSAFLFDAALGGNTSVGALAITPLGALGAFWQPAPHVAVGLRATIPLASAQASAPEGSARVATWQMRADARIEPLSARHLVSPFFELGLGLIWFQVVGTRATSPFRVASEQLLSAGPDASIGVRWRLSSSWALCSMAGASVAFAKPVVEFAGRHVATLARPLAAWTLGMEYRANSPGSRDW